MQGRRTLSAALDSHQRNDNDKNIMFTSPHLYQNSPPSHSLAKQAYGLADKYIITEGTSSSEEPLVCFNFKKKCIPGYHLIIKTTCCSERQPSAYTENCGIKSDGERPYLNKPMT